MKTAMPLLTVILAVASGYAFWCFEVEPRIGEDLTYDPNDPAYKFIPEAGADWIEKFGNSERTRLLHTISELRVVVAGQNKRLRDLEDPNGVTK
jgi:hypothetical protein